jgi:hypothetical protein
MIPVESVPGMGERRIKKNVDRMIYLIYSKNFCKCHNVPPLSTTIKTYYYIKKSKKIVILFPE